MVVCGSWLVLLCILLARQCLCVVVGLCYSDIISTQWLCVVVGLPRYLILLDTQWLCVVVYTCVI